MDNEDSVPESVLLGNDAFVNKLLSRRSSGEQSLRCGYFCDKQCVVPFTWEEEPGIPKDPPKLDIVPPINPPRARSRPLHAPKCASSTQPRSFFLMMKPWRTTKPNKKVQRVLHGNQHVDVLEESREFGHYESYISEDDMFSSPCVSKNSSPFSARSDSTASSKGLTLALPSSKFCYLAKGLLRRFF